ncbi:MAG: molybdopterin-dependent oxidoreductase [Thermodesulfobacteriota bacterium]|nr:molybdopterin-dependent oxidoreductase [Thermodesulfobacteriota bacterium]
MKSITACTMDCPDSCSLLVWKDTKGSIQIRGNPDHPFTAGFCCAKIRKLPLRLKSPHRIVHPMVRHKGDWKVISWDEALDICATKINALRKEPSSILHFHGEGAKGVLKQANKLFFSILGASRTKGSLCDAAGFIATLMDCGSRFSNDIEDLLNARQIINWGKDLDRSSVHTAALVRKAQKRGARMLTIAPYMHEGRADADSHIRIRPGTDRFLAAAVIQLLIQQDLIPKNIVARTNHWDAFCREIFSYTLKEIGDVCQVRREDIDHLFDFYVHNGPAATIVGTGLQRYLYGGENVRFINALTLLSGNLGCSGGGFYFHEHALTSLNYDWASSIARSARRALPMPMIGQVLRETDTPPISMVWVNGSNFVNQAADSINTARSFEQVPFKVVVDAFMTDTAQRADLFLPSTLMLEQEDIVASYLHHYVHYVEPVFKAPGEAKSDFWILRELGKRLTPPIVLDDKETYFRSSLDTPYLNISLEELKAAKFVRTKRERLAYQDLIFDHPDGKYRLPKALHAEPDPPEEFPFRLLSLIRKEAMHSQILPEDHKLPIDVWVSSDNTVLKEMAPEDKVWLVSILGRVLVQLHTLEGLHPKVVLARRGTWMKLGGGLNQLVEATLSDIGNGAPFYSQYVRLEKTQNHKGGAKE